MIDARAHLEEAARIYDPERDRDAKYRFGVDTGASATLFLAHTRWQLGEIGRAQELIEEAVVRAVKSAHGATQTNAYYYTALFEIFRGRAAAALSAGRSVVELSRKHGLTVYLVWENSRPVGRTLAWRARDGRDGASRGARRTYRARKQVVGPAHPRSARRARSRRTRRGRRLNRIDGALALAVETGERWTDALLHDASAATSC